VASGGPLSFFQAKEVEFTHRGGSAEVPQLLKMALEYLATVPGKFRCSGMSTAIASYSLI
jgi:hypothetical protein